MSTLNLLPSSGHKRAYGSIDYQRGQHEIMKYSSDAEAGPECSRKARKIEHQGGLDVATYDKILRTNSITQDPTSAAFQTHHVTLQIQNTPDRPSQQGYSVILTPENLNLSVLDPSIIVNENLDNLFDAAFESHQEATQEQDALARDEEYYQSIEAPPGEWTVGLPYHPEARKRIERWLDGVQPLDMNHLLFWDDIDNFATNQKDGESLRYNPKSPLGFLEAYRWTGHADSDPRFQTPRLWMDLVIQKAREGENTLNNCERRQREILFLWMKEQQNRV